MRGTQIRWQAVGRVAAVSVAIVAGVAALPSLLGGDSPPPVPEDVGLGASASVSREPPLPIDIGPPVTPPAAAKMRPSRLRNRDRRRGGKPKVGEGSRHKEKGDGRKDSAGDRDAHGGRGPIPVQVYVPAYVPPPPSRPEFGIEP